LKYLHIDIINLLKGKGFSSERGVCHDR